MNHKPIHPAQLAVTLAMVKTGNGWPSKARIVLYVGAFEGGQWLTAGEIADATGLSKSYVKKLLRELTTERVLLRDDGGGGRRFWTEVNPDAGRWLKVPWAHDRLGLTQRLALHLQLARQAPFERFIDRSMWERCEGAKGRLLEWLSPSKPTPVRPLPEGGDDPDSTSGAAPASPHKKRPSNHGLSLLPGGAMKAGGLPKALSFTDGVDDTSVVEEGDGPTTTTVDPIEFRRCKSILMGRALPGPNGTKYVAQNKAAELAELLASHGVERVVAALQSTPRDMVPGLLQAAGAALDFEGDPESPEERDHLRDHLAARKAMLDRLVATAEAEGDDNLAASHRAERSECENALKDLAEGAA